MISTQNHADGSPAGSIAGSVQPTPTTYMLRRIVVAISAAVLVAIGVVAANGLPSGSVTGASTGASTGTGVTPIPTAVQDPGIQATAAGLDAAGEDLADVVVVEESEEPAPLPPRASRFVSQSPERVFDSREGAPLSNTDSGSITIGDGRTAVALSVSVLGATERGSVSIDGGAGIVDAVVAVGPGASTTNLVFVPILGSDLIVRSSTGGHVVIDVVGAFEQPNQSNGGRFVKTSPIEVAKLVTETDGREATLAFDTVVPPDQADAILVAITADVGSDGGAVRLGNSEEIVDQMLMWGPPNGENPTRRGLVLIQSGPDWSARLRYDGGSVLTAEVVGYFTSDSTAIDDRNSSTDGLYIPTGPRKLFDGRLNDVEPTVIGGIEPLATTVVATVTVTSPSASSGFSGSQLIAAEGGTVILRSNTPAEAEITLLGVFLGGS